VASLIATLSKVFSFFSPRSSTTSPLDPLLIRSALT
jgi:hypothetical protein